MDMQFPKVSCSWLGLAGGDIKTMEQTLEVKLPDNLPDIGKVLCGWGQALVRSKQWNRDAVGLSGGVMAWVLYLPEDGSELRSVECWIPFQAKWDIPEREHDGVILADCSLLGVDGRSLSARKLMVRCNVALTARAMVEVRQDIAEAPQKAEGLELRKQDYSVLLPREAGEKMLSLEESVGSPGGWQPQKLLHYCIHPQVTDCKLMADRAVFRGSAMGHALCRAEDGQLHGWDFEIPFSQYSELDREYGPEARLQVTMVPTGLEMELGENGNLEVKGSLIGQYLVMDSQKIEAVTDAYSPEREVTLETVLLELPGVQEVSPERWQAAGAYPAELSQVLDCGFFPEPPQPRLYGTQHSADLTGKWQIMGQDSDGGFRCETAAWQETWELPEGEEAALWLWQSEKTTASAGTVHTGMDGAGYLRQAVTIPMVTGVSLGQPRAKAEDRPSVVLRKADGQGLWEMAKKNGTTVEKIMDANSLTQEPEKGTWLLVPVP